MPCRLYSVLGVIHFTIEQLAMGKPNSRDKLHLRWIRNEKDDFLVFFFFFVEQIQVRFHVFFFIITTVSIVKLFVANAVAHNKIHRTIFQLNNI